MEELLGKINLLILILLSQYSNKLSQRGEQIKEIQRLGDQTGLLKPVEVNAKTLTENVKAFKLTEVLARSDVSQRVEYIFALALWADHLQTLLS